MDYIEVIDLERSFKMQNNHSFQALKGISFNVKKGEIFGLLGPNGAGKTTTMKILSTMLAPTGGTAKIMGLNSFGDEKEVRKHINFVFGGERSLYWRLSAYDNLAYFSDLYKISLKKQKVIIPNLLSLVGLQSVSRKLVENFSKGMKQRLQIARALLNDPEIIFLDEPSIGLDPVGAIELRQLVLKLASRGTTIVLTTHYLHEAEELCDRIAIMNEGRIIAIDNLLGLQKLIGGKKCREIIEMKKEKFNGEKFDITLEDIYIELLRRDK